jgi:hypothetical protein
MSIYFAKNGDLIFRFASWDDLENVTGKHRKLFNGSLVMAIREHFPNAELAGRFGASIRGWITQSGEPVSGYVKGNYWPQRKFYSEDDKLIIDRCQSKALN